MVKSVVHYENRIARLKTAGEIKNNNLIKKAQRQMDRAIVTQETEEFQHIRREFDGTIVHADLA